MPFLFYTSGLAILYLIVHHPDLAFTLWMVFVLRLAFRICG